MKTNGLEILSENFKCFGFPKCILIEIVVQAMIGDRV
jgi:hypothetical protein